MLHSFIFKVLFESNELHEYAYWVNYIFILLAVSGYCDICRGRKQMTYVEELNLATASEARVCVGLYPAFPPLGFLWLHSLWDKMLLKVAKITQGPRVSIARGDSSEMLVPLHPRWSLCHSRAHTFHSGDPFMHSSHKDNKTLILEPRRTFSSKQLIWAPGNKQTNKQTDIFKSGKSFLSCRPTKWLFISSCRPKFLALKWEGGDGSRNQGLAETFHANQDDRPQTLQALNPIKLQKCFFSSRCWPCIWLAPLREAWGMGSFDYVFDPSHPSQVFPAAIVAGLSIH